MENTGNFLISAGEADNEKLSGSNFGWLETEARLNIA